MTLSSWQKKMKGYCRGLWKHWDLKSEWKHREIEVNDAKSKAMFEESGEMLGSEKGNQIFKITLKEWIMMDQISTLETILEKFYISTVPKKKSRTVRGRKCVLSLGRNRSSS